MEMVHAHPPEALIEGRERSHAAPDRVERRLELGAVVLMAIATPATAWCGYQAALWSGDLSHSFASAAVTRMQAVQSSTQGGQRRIDDLLYFNHWLDAQEAGDTELADLYRRRFRAEFVPVFEVWMAQRPFSNPEAIAGPLHMREYRLPEQVRSDELHAASGEHFEHGTQAKTNADRYILATVFMASVLFFAGISLRLDWRRLQIAVLAMACTLLVGGGAFVLTLPLA
jgi:hypothetical protein